MTAPGSIITSPNHPQNYPNNQNCRTVIRFKQGQRVLLQFLAFNLEAQLHSQCVWDWLEVRDGDNEYSNLIGPRLCGLQYPDPIVSSRNVLYIYFRTDSSQPRTGFEIKVGVVGKRYCT